MPTKRLAERIIHFFKRLWPRPGSQPIESWMDPRIQAGRHNCALVALAKVVPAFSVDRMFQGFGDCCDRWPYDGVTNTEFNITLRHLELFDKFKYDDSDDMKVSDFLSRKDDIFILLIHGHFAAIGQDIAYDNGLSFTSSDATVYCSWCLICR